MKKNLLTALLVLCVSTIFFASCKDDENVASVAGVTINPSSASLKPGETLTLAATIFPANAAIKQVTWSSSDTSVVKVNAAGIITAIKPGSATITAKSVENNESATCTVTVNTLDAISVSGNVSGVWKKYSVIMVDGQITIPKDSTLTIEEGVEIIISTAGQDANNTKIELIVNGNLYSNGTEDFPVTFTVAAASRTTANTFARLWGGIVGSSTCAEILLDHTIVEYTGAITTTTSPSVKAGLFKTAGGEGMVAFNTNNPSGKYVITNSTFRCTGEDAIYVQGGECIFTYNKFYAVGEAGGEAINVKAGCKVDAAYNLIYSPNTNGFKLSSSGQSVTRAQAQINAYNNTIINAGWRRDPTSPKGGCVWAEKNALVNVFNNLIVNCMFGSKAPSFMVSTSSGPDFNSLIDYNFYASGTQQSSVPQHVANGTITAYDGFKASVTDVVYGTNDIAGTAAGLNNPQFINFPFNTNPLLDYNFDTSWNFHLTSGSAAASGGKTNASPYFTSGITVNGKAYYSPLPATHFGAFGVQ